MIIDQLHTRSDVYLNVIKKIVSIFEANVSFFMFFSVQILYYVTSILFDGILLHDSSNYISENCIPRRVDGILRTIKWAKFTPKRYSRCCDAFYARPT